MPDITNIGPSGIARRRMSGVVSLMVAIVLLAALLLLEAPRWWRLALVLPLFSAGIGLFQARAKT